MAQRMGRPLGGLVLAWLACVTLVGAVLVSGTPALACSCAPPEIERWLAEADGAFIGTWVDRSDVGGGSAAVTFDVERVMKGSFGPKAIVRTNAQGSACGLELLGSRRTGLLLHRAADRVWGSDLCSMVSPEELLAVGEGHPPDPAVAAIGAGWSVSALAFGVCLLIAGIVLIAGLWVRLRPHRESSNEAPLPSRGHDPLV